MSHGQRDGGGFQLCCSPRIRHCDLILLQRKVIVDRRKLSGFIVYHEDNDLEQRAPLQIILPILFQPGKNAIYYFLAALS